MALETEHTHLAHIHLEYMARALRIAEKGKYSTHPNPCVGCVLVRQGEVIAEGFHFLAGEGHAEARALAQAGEKASGATAYVTLEPCSFHGRTPSCAQALIDAGVKEVVVATLDPDSRNAGAGIRMLENAGVSVAISCMEHSAQKLIAGHFRRYTNGRPFVRLKLAMTLDGKTALANGESRWITSPESRADVQKIRAMSAAIVTGVQTVIDDDPQLNVRVEELSVPEPHVCAGVARPVYILDSTLRTPLTSRLLETESTVIVTTQERRDGYPVELLQMAADDGRVDLESLLRELAIREHSEVLFECGPTLAGSLIAKQMVDELIIYVAPRLIGSSGRSLLNLPEVDRMSDLANLAIQDIRQIGPDIRVTASRPD